MPTAGTGWISTGITFVAASPLGRDQPGQCWTAVRNAMAKAHGRLDRDGEKFLSELLWREFSYHLLHHRPDLPQKPFQRNLRISRGVRSRRFGPLATGTTGYPIVDAGMRELWATGYMHNRVRMIAASFLIKDLLIDWREGETGSGTPWSMRISPTIRRVGSGLRVPGRCGTLFPDLQSGPAGEKFDPRGHYIRKWCPELDALPDRIIHEPWENDFNVKIKYSSPMVDHQMARNRALQALKSLA